MELDFNEAVLINLLRIFDHFLGNNGYVIVGLTFQDRNGEFLLYNNLALNQFITFSYGSAFEFEVVFEKRRLSLIGSLLTKPKIRKISQLKASSRNFSTLPVKFNIENNEQVLKAYLEFMKTELLPILRGEQWPD